MIAGSDELCTNGSVSVEHKDLDRDTWASTKPDGSLELRGLAPGTYKVNVYCDGYKALDRYEDLTIKAGDRLDKQWEVEEGRAILGRVVGADGEPVARAWVRAIPKSVEGREQLGSFVVSVFLTGRIARALHPFFQAPPHVTRRDLIGKICTIKTGRVDRGFGQAEVLDAERSTHLVQVRCEIANELTAGRKALIIDVDDEGIFLVSPDVEAIT